MYKNNSEQQRTNIDRNQRLRLVCLAVGARPGMQREKTTTFSDCSKTQKYHLHSDIHRPTVVAKLRVLIIFIASSMCLRLSYISLTALYKLAVSTTHNQIIHAPKCYFCDVMVDFHMRLAKESPTELAPGNKVWRTKKRQSFGSLGFSWECRSPLVLAPSHPISSHLCLAVSLRSWPALWALATWQQSKIAEIKRDAIASFCDRV